MYRDSMSQAAKRLANSEHPLEVNLYHHLIACLRGFLTSASYWWKTL